jgi:hypothetical protein
MRKSDEGSPARRRHLAAIVGSAAIFFPAWTFASRAKLDRFRAQSAPSRHSHPITTLDDQTPQSPTAASFTLGPGDDHEVSGKWKIDKPADEGDPETQYADDDHPELLQASYSDSK